MKKLKYFGYLLIIFAILLTVYQMFEWNKLQSKQENFLKNAKETEIQIDEILQTGDLLVRIESVNYEMQFINDIITYYGGGHTGIYYNNGLTLESYGASKPDNIANFYDANIWNNLEGTIIVLRPKEKINQEKIKKIIESYNEIPYDFLFNSFNKNLYCSELIVQIYREYGIDIDDDGLILQTPIDIAVAKNLDIIYLRKDGINYKGAINAKKIH